MNAVGIDVSKGKSKFAVIQPFGAVVRKPFDVAHTAKELADLLGFIRSLDGETRVVLEHTGKYSEPTVKALSDAGVFVCVVNAKLVHDYGGDSIRRDKTDKVDALKIAGYCLDKWAKLKRYAPTDERRKLLKTYNRQLSEHAKLKTMLVNNLIALIDQVFPCVNSLFSSPARESDGHEKWIDFAAHFGRAECVGALSQAAFSEKYDKWCHKNGYKFSSDKAEAIYRLAKESVVVLPKNDFTKTLISQSIAALNALCETISALKTEMGKIAVELPEYGTVLAMHGVLGNRRVQNLRKRVFILRTSCETFSEARDIFSRFFRVRTQRHFCIAVHISLPFCTLIFPAMPKSGDSAASVSRRSMKSAKDFSKSSVAIALIPQSSRAWSWRSSPQAACCLPYQDIFPRQSACSENP
jgi:hypothetical protein